MPGIRYAVPQANGPQGYANAKKSTQIPPSLSLKI
jgi:hypothetical protein